jgi:hypothetical protein
MGLLGRLEGFGKAIVDGAGAVGDFIERVGKVTKLDDVIDVRGRLADWAKRAGLNKFLRAANSPILDGGQLVIAGMKLTTGVGEPEDGERFGQGGARCHETFATLRSAQPTASWWGEGANSYSAQNVKQMARTKTMAAVDHEVHRVIATEAFQVNMHRDRLDDWYNWLADVGLVTFALGLIPGVGQGLKAAADAHAVLAAVGSSSLELHQLSSEAAANAAALQQLVGRYDDVAETAKLSPTGLDQSPPPPRPSRSAQPEPPASDVPGDVPRDEQPDDGTTTPSDEPPGQFSAPAPVGSGGGSGAGSGGGGGSPASAGSPAAPPMGTPAPQCAAEPPTSRGASAPAALGAPPAASGGVPPGVMSAGTAPMAAAAAVPLGLIKEAVREAMQREAEQRAKEDDPEDEKDEKDKDKNKEDKDGDGKPDEDAGPDEAAGATDAGPARVRIEKDDDVAQPNTPVTDTVDRNNPIGPSPTPTP